MKLPKLRTNFLIFLLILAVGTAFRVRNWEVGVIDAHPMRQTDSECVAYFMAKGAGSLLYPKNCLMRPVTNTKGYFFLEFPLYEGLIALGYKMFGVHSSVYRVINLGLYWLSVGGVYYFVKKLLDNKIALFSALLFSLAPASVFFIGHALHPDVFAVATMSLSLGLMTLNIQNAKDKEQKTIYKIIVAEVLLGLSVATRPFGLIVLPVYMWILYKNKAIWWQYALLGILSVGFYGGWRVWVLHTGITADWENWVLTGREKLFDFDTLFRRLIWINISGQVIGRAISVLAVGGMVVGLIKKDKRLLPIIGWLSLVPIYWLIVPDGNLTHQYYADVYIIPIAIMGAVGLSWVWSKSEIAAVTALLIVGINGYRTSDYYFKDLVPTDKLVYAKEIQENIPENATVLYLVKSDSTTLSLSHRQGWMLGEWPTDVTPQIWAMMEMKHYGLEYLAEPKDNMDIDRSTMSIVAQNYPLLKETEHLRIYKWVK